MVANRSAIGEQYVDLRPRTDAGPYLAEGDVIAADRATLPPRVETVLKDSRDFADSVPRDDLRTVVDELYEATRGSAEPLRRLLGTSTDLLETADRNLPATRRLIDSSATVLATQERVGGQHPLLQPRPEAVLRHPARLGQGLPQAAGRHPRRGRCSWTGCSPGSGSRSGW